MKARTLLAPVQLCLAGLFPYRWHKIRCRAMISGSDIYSLRPVGICSESLAANWGSPSAAIGSASRISQHAVA